VRIGFVDDGDDDACDDVGDVGDGDGEDPVDTAVILRQQRFQKLVPNLFPIVVLLLPWLLQLTNLFPKMVMKIDREINK